VGAEHGREVQGTITGRGEILQQRGLGPAAELLRPARRGRREWDPPLAVPEDDPAVGDARVRPAGRRRHSLAPAPRRGTSGYCCEVRRAAG
jgi:hypothetical protein